MSLSCAQIPIGLAVLVAVALAARAHETPPPLETFCRAALVERFDRNRDDALDARERAALREAFGGIDVPMLESPLPDYRGQVLPAHFRESDLAEWDNMPSDNPVTNEGVTLGRVLFYDKQLSRSNTIACASCHRQQAGFADPRRFSEGFAGGHTKRNAPGLANLRYTNLKGRVPGFFWDERAATLEDQVLMPIQDPVEMGMQLDQLEQRLAGLPYYPPLFQAAFGSPAVTRDRIAQAVAQFLRAMTSTASRWDQAAAEADDLLDDFPEFSREENFGKRLFFEGVGGIAEFACAMCHVPPTFNMPTAMNIGLELKSPDPGLGALGLPPNDPFTPSNDGKFKAPSLRNVALTAPYMHDGRFKTLDEVVTHYSEGVHPHENLGLGFEPTSGDAETSGFHLTADEKAALVAFLKTLTDNRFLQDPSFSDPFVREE